ncbi:MAG: hypothetical protein HY657_05080 [Acidobacteria bacterium]|nr:hypothetical protein [Acidobacteriota bacterium]
MAYASDESGPLEVYVQSVPAGTGRWQISPNGGFEPRWRADGRELFYVAADRRLMSVTVAETGGALQAGVPRPLFATEIDVNPVSYPSQYDVSRDGQRFLIKRPALGDTPAPITLVFNWASALLEP